MRTWYIIKALAATEPAEISIHDEIGAFGINAKNFINDLKKIEANEINLTINSPGGSVFDGIAMYNALRNSGKTINVKVLGVAASIASLVAMAGDKITMPENAFLMVHNPWAFTKGNADELRDFADVLDKIGASLVATYVARTGKSEEEVRALLNEETYLSAQEAKDLGFADEIEPALKIAASFDIDCLPENVRVAFQAAKPGDGGGAGGAGGDGDDDDKQIDPAFADQVKDLATQAGLEDFASVFALRTDKIDEARSQIATAREIKALCDLAKQPDAAAAYIRAAKPLAEVRAELCNKLAVQDEGSNTDTAPGNAGTPTAKAQPAALKTADIWAARRKSI